MALDLTNTVVDFLKRNPQEKFTARHLADWIFQTYPNECQEKMDRSNVLRSEADLLQQLVREIGSRRGLMHQRFPEIKTTEGRPRWYYYTETSDEVEVDLAEGGATEGGANGSRLREHDLYPILSEFLWSEYDVYSKRIDEKRSRNTRGSGGNKWLYPDVVGLEDLSSNWHQEVKDCVGQYADKKTKLWSFEVKILVNRSNVREVFFQAISNSSWANFGYLVASEIEGVDTLKELRMLSSLHGIGFIRLEAGNPAESQILIPAKERSEIDWDTANRLTEENVDFRDYLKLIRQFYQTGDIREADWDIITRDD